MNNPIIAFFFTVLVFVFGVYVVFNSYESNEETFNEALSKQTVSQFTSGVDRYCRDPFIANYFDIQYQGGVSLYIRGERVCAYLNRSDSQDFLYCERAVCNVDFCEDISFNNCAGTSERTFIINENFPVATYRFEMKRSDDGKTIYTRFSNN